MNTELTEAKEALTSLLKKCEKAKEKLKEKTSQSTLLERRIKALQVALNLINEKILKCDYK